MATRGQSHMAIQLHVHTAIRHYGHIITSLFLNTTIRIQRCTTTWLQLWRSTLTVLHGIAGDCYMSMWLYGYMAQRQYDSVAARLYSCTTCANDCITGIAISSVLFDVQAFDATLSSLCRLSSDVSVLYCYLLGRMVTSWHSWYRSWNLWPYGWHQKSKRHA